MRKIISEKNGIFILNIFIFRIENIFNNQYYRCRSLSVKYNFFYCYEIFYDHVIIIARKII